jgi:hypothetical protein
MTIEKVYPLEQIDQWVREGQSVSPKVAKELLYRIQELDRKLAMCKEFVEWVGSYGEARIQTPEGMAMEARDLMKHLSKE